MNRKSTGFEKVIYGMGNVGANLCWTFMMIYVTMYYTDSAGVAAAAVGSVMLIARFLDGISDVIGAIMIEKVHFKMGKIRPWFLISGPLLGISMWFCFHVPMAWDAQAKAVYVFVTYTFTAAISYTIYNLAFSSILPLMSLDNNDRNKASTVGQLITNIGVMVMNIITPTLLGMWGGLKSQGAWGTLTTIYSVVCAVLIFSMGLFIKEKNESAQEVTEAGGEKEKINVFETLKVVLTTRYTWLLLGLFACFYLCSGITGIRVYFFRDVLGDFNMFALSSTLSSLAMMITMLFVPAAMKKIGKNKVVVGGIILYIVCYGLLGVVGRMNVYTAIACITVGQIGQAPIAAVIYTYIADLVDYIANLKGGKTEGYVSAVSMASSVGTKIGTGLGSAFVGWGLAFFGYNAMAEMQSAAVQSGITLITVGVPIAMSVLMLVGLKVWKLGDK